MMMRLRNTPRSYAAAISRHCDASRQRSAIAQPFASSSASSRGLSNPFTLSSYSNASIVLLVIRSPINYRETAHTAFRYLLKVPSGRAKINHDYPFSRRAFPRAFRQALDAARDLAARKHAAAFLRSLGLHGLDARRRTELPLDTAARRSHGRPVRADLHPPARLQPRLVL